MLLFGCVCTSLPKKLPSQLPSHAHEVGTGWLVGQDTMLLASSPTADGAPRRCTVTCSEELLGLPEGLVDGAGLVLARAVELKDKGGIVATYDASMPKTLETAMHTLRA